MKITMLGTGNASATECYNTCFILEENSRRFLVDGGGGNYLMHQIKHAGIDWKTIHEIFVTHKHTDHLLGIIWLIRMICQSMSKDEYPGETFLYSHDEVISIIQDLIPRLLRPKETWFLGERLHLIPVTDGETHRIIGNDVTFFDIHSTKANQFGFSMTLADGRRLTCCGDEPCNECEKEYAYKSNWLLHEAFCLYSQADLFHPYEKHHSTVKDACMLAEDLEIENLLLYHTEDQNIGNRRELYLAEGSKYFHGRLWIPDDLEVLEI